MKLAFLLPSLKNLGPIIVVKSLIDFLYKNYKLNITVFYFDDFDSDILDFNVDCININFFEKYDFSEFDIVHSHGIRPDLYSKIHKLKNNLVSTQHNIIFDEYNISGSYIKAKLVEIIWKYALTNKSVLVAIGDAAKEYYNNLLPNHVVVNIPNGRSIEYNFSKISIEDIEKINFLKEKYICIGTCTRVLKLKGHTQIIRALSKLPNFCFILVGDGDYLENIKDLAFELKVSERCLFLGYKKNATDYLSLFDIYIQASYTESISIALLEAAAAKKAVVCSKIPSNEIFTTEEVVFFELDNILNLSHAINSALINKKTLENNIYQKYKNEYTLEIMATRYYNLYKDLVDEN